MPLKQTCLNFSISDRGHKINEKYSGLKCSISLKNGNTLRCGTQIPYTPYWGRRRNKTHELNALFKFTYYELEIDYKKVKLKCTINLALNKINMKIWV